MTTKEKITTQALTLFNKTGVEKVTTRHIAEQLGMSQGNLHYHYPNKEAIIHALYHEFASKQSAAKRYEQDTEFSREAVLASMSENYTLMYRYRFLFNDNQAVWRRVPAIKKEMISMMASQKGRIKTLIEQYKREGVLRTEISNQQIDFLADQFIFSISAWLHASPYLDQQRNLPDYFARFTFRMWLPYLVPAEMKQWEALL